MTQTSSPRRTPAPRATPGKKPKTDRAGAGGARCCEEHHKLEVARRADEKVLKEAAKDEALRLKPGSTVHSAHFNPDGTAILDMTFPSGVRRYHTFLDWLASEEGQRQ